LFSNFLFPDGRFPPELNLGDLGPASPAHKQGFSEALAKRYSGGNFQVCQNVRGEQIIGGGETGGEKLTKEGIGGGGGDPYLGREGKGGQKRAPRAGRGEWGNTGGGGGTKGAVAPAPNHGA